MFFLTYALDGKHQNRRWTASPQKVNFGGQNEARAVHTKRLLLFMVLYLI